MKLIGIRVIQLGVKFSGRSWWDLESHTSRLSFHTHFPYVQLQLPYGLRLCPYHDSYTVVEMIHREIFSTVRMQN